MLDEHLVRLVDGATTQNTFFEFCCVWHLACYDVDRVLLEQPDKRLYVRRHAKAQCDAFVAGKVGDTVEVVAQRIAVKDEEAGGAIKRAHHQRVGERVGVCSLAATYPRHHHQ